MFGFSLTKLLFTVAIVYVAWNAFKYFNRMQDQRMQKAKQSARMKTKNGGATPRSQTTSRDDGIEDMVECTVCNAYVMRGAKFCGRDNCPFGG